MKKATATVGLAVAALTLVGPASAAPRFERCGPYGAGCARLSVPLDRSGAVPGRVSLFVKRIRATRRPTRGAVFALAGGPGQSATDAFGGDAISLSSAFRDRDLVVMDQRGTGRSDVLRCRFLERPTGFEEGPRSAARCARRLGPRRAFYTSRDSAEDIEAVRLALGYERITLFGTSYGTKVALGYALSHPGAVERLVLDSVVEAEGPDPLYLDSLSAVPRALRSLCRAGCGRFTPDPLADVDALTARLARSPLRGRLVDARGRARPTSLGRGDPFAVLLAGDVDPGLRAAFPAAVRSAVTGDAAPLLRLRRRSVSSEGPPFRARYFSLPLFVATSCEETRLPWPRDTPPDPGRRGAFSRAAIAALPPSAFFPFDRAAALTSDLIELCGRWPASPVAPVFGPGPLPDVPVLLIEGEDDLRTPVENARRVAAQFPRASLVVAPGTGHSALGSDASNCTLRAFTRFMADRPVSACRARPRGLRPESPAPRSIAALRPNPAVRGARGRVLTAVALTLRDVGEDALTALIFDRRDPDLARGGGLRAGSYRIDTRSTLFLKGLAYVPGVQIDGRLTRFGRASRVAGRLRVRSRRGVPGGTLTLRAGRLSGRLGGRAVRAGLSPRLTAAEVRATAARLSGGPR